MSKIELNYRIEAFEILLNENCIASRYFPLIPYKTILIKKLTEIGCKTNRDCRSLTDQELMQAGLEDAAMVMRFRAFLGLHDVSKQKFKEIETVQATDQEKTILYELYKLGGVRLTRAMLYYRAGYTSLQQIANASTNEIITATTYAIATYQLPCQPPLPKEVNTHIAVSKALVLFSA